MTRSQHDGREKIHLPLRYLPVAKAGTHMWIKPLIREPGVRIFVISRKQKSLSNIFSLGLFSFPRLTIKSEMENSKGDNCHYPLKKVTRFEVLPQAQSEAWVSSSIQPERGLREE